MAERAAHLVDRVFPIIATSVADIRRDKCRVSRCSCPSVGPLLIVTVSGLLIVNRIGEIISAV